MKVKRRYDSEIVDLVYSIMNNGTFRVETYNESRLVKLFELRGTPLTVEKSYRDIEKDWKEESSVFKNTEEERK